MRHKSLISFFSIIALKLYRNRKISENSVQNILLLMWCAKYFAQYSAKILAILVE